MSNQLLGNVYSLIMDDVIENCQTTFEEDGVAQQTLEDLRSTWQTKLTALHVGSFPWEPQPAPQPMPGPMTNPTVPSNAPRSGQLPSNGPGPASGNGQPRIKQEPNVEPQHFKGMTPGYTNNVAQERAAQQLQQRFGPDAQAQINRLQQQSAMNMNPQYSTQGSQQRPPMGGQYSLPPANQMTEKQREAMEYQRRAALSQAPPKPQNPPQSAAQPQPVANVARTDGADDWDAFVAQRRVDAADAPENVFASSDSLRTHVERQNKTLEGGGLMLPLAQQTQISHPPQRTAALVAGENSSNSYAALVAAQSSKTSVTPKATQFDGAGDDEDDEDDKTGIKDELFGDDDDEDAINSDLDDPDDNAIEEEQDEGRPNQIMLCTYDKVQRVKNKWKCTLKDGVLNTGGKDYVFTKANGEFEW